MSNVMLITAPFTFRLVVYSSPATTVSTDLIKELFWAKEAFNEPVHTLPIFTSFCKVMWYIVALQTFSHCQPLPHHRLFPEYEQHHWSGYFERFFSWGGKSKDSLKVNSGYPTFFSSILDSLGECSSTQKCLFPCSLLISLTKGNSAFFDIVGLILTTVQCLVKDCLTDQSARLYFLATKFFLFSIFTFIFLLKE